MEGLALIRNQPERGDRRVRGLVSKARIRLKSRSRYAKKNEKNVEGRGGGLMQEEIRRYI